MTPENNNQMIQMREKGGRMKKAEKRRKGI
jgi:hypothetical protein